MKHWIALLLMTFTLDQLRSAECKVACQFTGRDGGIFWKENCYCFDIVDYYEITNRKRIMLPKKAGRSGLSSYVAPAETPAEIPWRYRGYPKEDDSF
jgi:hypothetical protein